MQGPTYALVEARTLLEDVGLAAVACRRCVRGHVTPFAAPAEHVGSTRGRLLLEPRPSTA